MLCFARDRTADGGFKCADGEKQVGNWQEHGSGELVILRSARTWMVG